MINLETKFEVSMFTYYKDMEGNAKCRHWGDLGVRGHSMSPAMSPFDRVHTTSYSTLIETMRLSCTVFELRRVICQKSPILTYTPPAFSTQVRRGPVWISPTHQITTVSRLSCGVVSEILRLVVLTQYPRVTDRQTDRRTVTRWQLIPALT